MKTVFDYIKFDNSYARLPGNFFIRQKPIPVNSPQMVILNRPLIKELGWEEMKFADDEAALVLSGNLPPQGSDPIAMVYAGHQFGNFVPRLGDGRALLLGEVIDVHGVRRDIHLKGSGITPYARGADGRSPLGPAIREYVISEAMHALGIPTTRSLAVVTTGETVMRDRILPGAVLTRVALSHVRVGTFEYFAARDDYESVRTLADYIIHRLYPELKNDSSPYLALLDAVIKQQAYLVAKWMSIGFIHGVMNTDNMAVSGEGIDYGPCAFMDEYDPAKVFSSIDRTGRYAFGNQALVAKWNIARFAETLLPLIHTDPEKSLSDAESAVQNFTSYIQENWYSSMRRKLGLSEEMENDDELIGELLELMFKRKVDYTSTFRFLCDAVESSTEGIFLGDSPEATAWTTKWRKTLQRQKRDKCEIKKSMLKVNPVYIPRNHLIERAISEAVDKHSYDELYKLMEVLVDPFLERAGLELYALPPCPHERVIQTFCGT